MKALITIVVMAGILIIPLSSATWGSHFNTPITLSDDAITEM